MATYVRDMLASFENKHFKEPVYHAIETCSVILSEIDSNPPGRTVTDAPSISFPPTLGELEFTKEDPHQVDILAWIAFQIFPFISPAPWLEPDLGIYLKGRKNQAAIVYALSDCDLTRLAQKLSDYLPYPMQEGDNVNTIICHITTVASCVHMDSTAIEFIDKVLAGRPPGFLPQHSAITAVQYLRCLCQVNQELHCMSKQPDSSMLPDLQKICQDELFQPLSPLFLPRSADIPTVIQSLQTHLLNKYTLFLSHFLQNVIPAATKTTIPAFNDTFFPDVQEWMLVDQEIQQGFSTAILAYIESIKPYYRSNQAVLEGVWHCSLFWTHSRQGRWINLDWLTYSCLPLLRKAIKLYNVAAETHSILDEESPLDTESSALLLAKVEDIISGSRSDAQSTETRNKASVEESVASEKEVGLDSKGDPGQGSAEIIGVELDVIEPVASSQGE
jgi:hypothetical protein